MWKAWLAIMQKRGPIQACRRLRSVPSRNPDAAASSGPGVTMLGVACGACEQSGPYASLLDAVMDEPCHATRHTPPPTPTPGASVHA